MSVPVETLVDLNERVLSALGMLRNSLGERIALSTILAVPLGAIRVDAGALQAAILHLVGIFHNAIPNGGGLLLETESICFEVGEDCGKLGLMPGEYVCLNISDTAPTLGSSASLPPDCKMGCGLRLYMPSLSRMGGPPRSTTGQTGTRRSASIYRERRATSR